MAQLATTIFILILLTSLAAWAMVIERLTTGQSLVSRRVPVVRPRPLIAILLTAAWILFSLSSHLLPDRETPNPGQFNGRQALFVLAFNLLVQVTTTCVLLICLTELGNKRLTRFGIDGRKLGEDMGTGLMGYFATVIPVLLVNIAMSSLRNDDNQHLFLQILRSDQSVPLVGLMVGSAVIMAPLEEELMYRVILQGTLQRYLSPAASIMISSVIFAGVHGLPDALGLFPLALILGFLYWRTGSYLSIITTHAMFNGMTIFLTILRPQG